MRSSGSKYLNVVKPADAERLLEDLANLKYNEVHKFLTHHAVFFSHVFTKHPVTQELLLKSRDTLRKAWTAQTSFHRDWYISRLQLGFAINYRAIERGIDTTTATRSQGSVRSRRYNEKFAADYLSAL